MPRFFANYHTHTTLCDGTDTPAAMAEAAYKKGFAVLGFSGHMDPGIRMDWEEYRAVTGALRERYAGRMDILTGVELDQLRPRDAVPGAEYVIGSTHFIPLPDGEAGCVDHTFEKSRRICGDCFGGDWYRMAAAYYEAEAKVFEKTRCDIIGHFDLITRFNHEHPSFDEEDPRYLRPAMDALEVLARTGAVFEVNCGAYNRGRRRDVYPARPLLKRLRELGATVCLSSDAHSAALLDGGFDFAAEAMRACGFREIAVWKHDGPSGRVVRTTTEL